MTTRPPEPSSITGMKGGGYYDTHSSVQAKFLEAIEPLIDETIQSIPLPEPQQPFTMVDYGCSEGRDSMEAMSTALRRLWQRAPGKDVIVMHEDLPTNNFNQLFHNVYLTEQSYLHDAELKDLHRGRVLVFASGASFYEPVAPARSVHFGFSSTSVHWMSRRLEVSTPEQMLFLFLKEEVRQQFAELAQADWARFLEYRAAEMVSGGELVVTMLARPESDADTFNESGIISPRGAYDLMHQAVQDMIAAGLLSPERYAHYTLPLYYRSVSEATAPVVSEDGPLHGVFELKHISMQKIPCPIYDAYAQSGHGREYAQALVAWNRAWSEPTMAAELFGNAADGTPGPNPTLTEDFYHRLEAKVLEDPEARLNDEYVIHIRLCRQ